MLFKEVVERIVLFKEVVVRVAVKFFRVHVLEDFYSMRTLVSACRCLVIGAVHCLSTRGDQRAPPPCTFRFGYFLPKYVVNCGFGNVVWRSRSVHNR